MASLADAVSDCLRLHYEITCAEVIYVLPYLCTVTRGSCAVKPQVTNHIRRTNCTMKSTHGLHDSAQHKASMQHGPLLWLQIQGDKLVWRRAKTAFDRCQLFVCKHGGTHEEQEGARFILEIGLKALCSSP